MRHDDTGRDDDIMDRKVSDAYRDLATERAPGHLDKAILANASRGARTSRGPMLRWRRPLAWTATIALSFALLLEFTQGPDFPSPPAALEPAEPAADALAASPTNAPERANGAEVVEAEIVEEFVVATPDANLAQEPAVQSEAAKRDRLRELETMSSPQASSEYADQDVAPAPAPAEELREAAAVAAARQERYLSPDTLSKAIGDPAEVDIDELPCSGETREDAEAWRDCILELREAGELEDAFAEAVLFRETFPNEPLPKQLR